MEISAPYPDRMRITAWIFHRMEITAWISQSMEISALFTDRMKGTSNLLKLMGVPLNRRLG